MVEQYKFVEEALKHVSLKFSTGGKIKHKKKDAPYDAIVISCRAAHLVQETKEARVKETCSLLIESPAHLVEVTDEHQAAFKDKIIELAESSTWIPHVNTSTQHTNSCYMSFHKT